MAGRELSDNLVFMLNARLRLVFKLVAFFPVTHMNRRYLVKNFYNTTFPSEGQSPSVPYHERTSRAMRDAVRKLREKVRLKRWETTFTTAHEGLSQAWGLFMKYG